MSAPFGMYGGYKYESPESRSLGSITKESYDYRDQGKFLSKMAGDVSYMASYMRKMQKGIDDANQNFVQQLQSMINDVLVIAGGGGDTGLDFGDLKYVIQAFFSLFGFDLSSGLPLPLNLFQAAWHFFSNYIVPVNNFKEVIDMIIDGAIATVLDIFGDVPILGQALQQLAVIISNLRDAFGPLITALDKIFGIFSGDWMTGDFGLFDPLWDAVTNFFGVITGPIVAALVPILEIIATWSVPFINLLAQVVEWASDFIGLFTFGLTPVGHIGDTQPNLFVAPGFGYASNVAPGNGWVQDPTKGRTEGGSVRVTANGIDKRLLSNAIPVSAGQELDISIWVQWFGLSYTGTPIRVKVDRLVNGGIVGTDDLAAPTVTGSNQTSWVQVAGHYVVPAGCDKISVELYVSSTTTAGNVWWDDASAKKTGTINQSWITNLIPDLAGILDTVQNVIDGIANVFRLIPIFGAPIADMIDLLTDFFLGTEDTAAVASDAVLGVQATQEIIASATTQNPQPGVTDADLQLILDAQTQAITNMQAQVDALTQVQSAQSNSGNYAIEQFEYVNTTTLDTGLWDTSTYTEGSAAVGKIAVEDGHNAGMKLISSSGVASQIARYIGPVNKTLTPYQTVSVVIAEAMSSYAWWGDARLPALIVYARLSDDKQTWVRFIWFFHGYIRFEYKNGAADTIHTLAGYGDYNSGIVPNVNMPMTVEAGNAGSVRTYTLRSNAQIIHTIVDSGGLTNATEKGAGFGQRIDNGRLPGKITQFSMADSIPAPTVGVGLDVYRNNASAILKNAGRTPFAANTFDAIRRQSAGIGWDGENATILIPGWYTFDLKAKTNSVPQQNELTGSPTLFLTRAGVGPTAVKEAVNWTNPTAGGSAVTYYTDEAGSGSLKYYFEANDIVTPGMNTSRAMGVLGDTSGLYSWFSLVLVNRSLA